MSTDHPNLSLLERFSNLIPHDLASAEELLAENFVWHYFNPRLPELEGDYAGLNGLQTFFQKLGSLTNHSFQVKDRQAFSVGDELVVTSAKPMLTLEGQSLETDAVVVWRMVGNRIVEAWDIPAIHTKRPQTQD